MIRSTAQMLCIGRDDAQLARRAQAVGRDVDDVRRTALGGTPGELVDVLGQWRDEAGVTRVYLQVLDLSDLDQIEAFATDVVPQLS